MPMRVVEALLRCSLALVLFVAFGCTPPQTPPVQPGSNAATEIEPLPPDLGPPPPDLGPLPDLGPAPDLAPTAGGPCAGQADGTSCDDGDACTQTDRCQAGACVGADPITCSPVDACHAAGTCHPTSGQCTSPAASDGTVDQAQLQCPGWYVILAPSQQPIGQTFVAGAGGHLTAVEVGLHRCGQDDPSAMVQLAVSDGDGTVIAAASLPVTQLPDDCSGSGLDASAITGALFDLTGSCAQIAAGQSLSLSMSLDHLTPSVCDPTTWSCSGGGDFCEEDRDCEIALRVDMTGNQYAAGDGTVRGAGLGDDLTFKTFVLP
jgi:hypothetical protein